MLRALSRFKIVSQNLLKVIVIASIIWKIATPTQTFAENRNQPKSIGTAPLSAARVKYPVITTKSGEIIPDKGGFIKSESRILIDVSIIVLKVFTGQKFKKERITQISNNCLQSMRASSHSGQSFFSEASASQSPKNYLSLFQLASGNLNSPNTCQSVLYHYTSSLVKNSKDLTGIAVRRQFIQNLNTGVRVINDLYGKAPDNALADPFYKKYSAIFEKSLTESGITEKLSQNSILNLETKLATQVGTAMAEDFIERQQLVTEHFFRSATAGAPDFNQSLPQAREQLKQLGNSLPAQQRKEAKLVTSAILSGSPDAKKKLGLVSSTNIVAADSPLSSPDRKWIEGSVTECLKNGKSLRSPSDCFEAAISQLQKPIIEATLRTLPEFKESPDSDQKPWQKLKNWKQILAQALKATADKIDWKKNSTAETWFELAKKSIQELSMPYFTELAKQMAQVSGRKLSPTEQQKLLASIEAKLRTELGCGIAQILGDSRSTAGRDCTGAARLNSNNTFSYGAPNGEKKQGTFRQCIISQSENIEGIQNRVKCFMAAAQALEEPAFEWIAKNFPEGEGKLKVVSDTIRHQADIAFKKAGTVKHPHGGSLRINQVLLGTAKTLAGQGYAELHESLLRDSVKISAGSAGDADPARPETSPGVPDDLKVAGVKSAENAVEEIWGEKPRDKTKNLASSNTFQAPEGIAAKLKGDSSVITLKACLDLASTISERLSCFESAKENLDEIGFEWVTKNFPPGNKQHEIISQSIAKASQLTYPPGPLNWTKQERFDGFLRNFHKATIEAGLAKAKDRADKNNASEKNPDVKEARSTSLSGLAGVISEQGKDALPQTVSKAVVTSPPESFNFFNAGMKLGSQNCTGNTCAETAAVQALDQVGAKPEVQRAGVDWLGSLSLGINGKEGRTKLLEAWDSLQKSPDSVPVPPNFYQAYAQKIKVAIQSLKPDPAGSIKSFIEGLDQSLLREAGAIAIGPLLEEIQYQSFCHMDLPVVRPAGSPPCGCITNGGNLKSRLGSGNILSPELSLVTKLMRNANDGDREPSGRYSPSIGCRNKVKSFLNGLPENIQKTKASFFKSPLAFLKTAIDQDRLAPVQEGKPKLLECIVAGNISGKIAPLIKPAISKFDSKFGPASDQIFSTTHWIKMMNGTHPDNQNPRDQIVSDVFNKTQAGLSDLLGNTSGSRMRGLSEDAGLGEKISAYITATATTFTMAAVTSRAIYRPLLEAKFPKSKSLFNRLERENPQISKTRLQNEIEALNQKGRKLASHKSDSTSLDQALDQVGKHIMTPIALLAGASAENALSKRVSNDSKNETRRNFLDQCEQPRDPNAPMTFPTKEEYEAAAAMYNRNVACQIQDTTSSKTSIEKQKQLILSALDLEGAKKRYDKPWYKKGYAYLKDYSSDSDNIVGRLVKCESAIDELDSVFNPLHHVSGVYGL